MHEDLLLQVRKPARYIGQEWNSPKKDFNKSGLKVALCFPDLYELGMSNLGLRILYGVINGIDDASCERVFACDVDMEDALRANNRELCSLETGRRLRDFDLVGFALSYELTYTNVLNMLKLAGIPLYASQRSEEYPLIIAGGCAALNPEPMADFFDLFLIGEAEEAMVEVIGQLRQAKKGKISKHEKLLAFARIPGVYVPSFYDVRYNDSGQIEEFSPKYPGVPAKVKKRIVEDLDSSFFPVDWLVPFIEIVHDRITLEVMRGCPNACRFCQARSLYYPFRQRGVNRILQLANETCRKTGYEEISLAGLSVSDYKGLDELIKSLHELLGKNKVNLCLPSIKPKPAVGDISALLASIKKSGLTFAPEAGSERLRKILAKDFDSEVFFAALEKVYAAGWDHVKLYFMTGLPTETPNDLEDILSFTEKVSLLRKRQNKPAAMVNISINTMIPKPHTPFQWLGMQDLDGIRLTQEFIRGHLKNKKIKLSFADPQMSVLEGVLSRADRRVSAAIEQAHNLGCRFDAWSEHFYFTKWQEAFQKVNLDMNFYLKEKRPQDILPWSVIDLGVSNDWLRQQYEEIFLA